MPAKGKHRRPKSLSISRGFAAAGTGGAALALPLMGAAGAQAAGAPAAVPAVAPAAAPQLQTQAPVSLQAAPATAQAAPAVYTVVPGDYLSKIAAERQLSGGWERLYADNREAVGSDPSLIHPGLKLTLGAAGKAAPTQAAPAPAPAEKSSQKAPAAGKGSATEQDEPAAAPVRKPQSQPKQQSQGAGTSTGSAAGSNTVAAGGFVAPVSGGVSTQYRVAGAMWSSGYHTGLDFMASSGTTVKAVGAGTVVSAGWSGSYGNEVVIRHEDGKYSQYAHLSSLSVSSGQSVTAGQRIGLSGSTGNSTGPHLHFEIRTGPSYGSDINPLSYLRSKGVTI
ncbi:LysM peptidoglycan-binding domain-containing M23 family metallopeptidase [Streptomyces sp. NPDC055254]